ncbi:MAG: hypothetical protein JWM23_70 [Microbacteriaceae bacterium]|jgi:hypothetical protein|nr:hypothetical protein [Microbacteriaceae bacterium]
MQATHSRRSSGALFSLAGCILLGLALAGCSTTPPAAPKSPGIAVETRSAPSGASAPAPTLKPALSASENLAYFDSVATGVLAANPSAEGRAFIDALAAAGFDKTAMQVTFDSTAADLAADSIQFAVRFNGECLVGQTGPASGGYHSVVTALLGTGRCLVGATRQIDW